MARRKKRKQPEIGYCAICGNHGELSFEHVPPKAAYNKETLIGYEWLEHIQNRKSKKTAIQGGAGAYTLCEDCNTKTGSWYANEYVKWARTCHHIMVTWSKSNVQLGTVGLRDVYPLRFLKQVVTCFFSLVGSEGQAKFAETNPELVSFVLDKHNNVLPDGFRFFMNLYRYSKQGNTAIRRWPISARIRVQTDRSGNLIPLRSDLFDEIAHPPLQLVMTENNDPYEEATEITGFSKYGFDEQVNIDIQFRVLSGDSPYPGAG